MTDNRVYRTRSLGIPAAGLKDQYADGTAAQLWELYIGDKSHRTSHYRKFVTDALRNRNCKNVLDAACGTGVDSIMLLEEGFDLTSIDLSDKMLKVALKTRWDRRKEPAFDAWDIEEANWLTLPEDVPGEGQFDAVICMGNSFAHLPLMDEMKESSHLMALRNFSNMLKPGGVLVIDHRNYDHILNEGHAPSKNIYYNSDHIESIVTSVVITEGVPILVTLDYVMREGSDHAEIPKHNKFRLSYYPHRVKDFGELLKTAFGPGCSHSVYGDFKPVGEVEEPGFYIHIIQKAK